MSKMCPVSIRGLDLPCERISNYSGFETVKVPFYDSFFVPRIYSEQVYRKNHSGIY
ncbi:hypothetical protein NARC_60046 [Candidatus Nitrosocosmicus arcticus]|uniref:Uncharacterized protein n=1 Tax=Candidatus Nitrosocosmicus arcticus TaxID=2035267 RepID=A0A557SVM0_9ARCH|nr:hypothetical protein NARC_60046 [Candidatus Nitrosocosmicus arcticus]